MRTEYTLFPTLCCKPLGRHGDRILHQSLGNSEEMWVFQDMHADAPAFCRYCGFIGQDIRPRIILSVSESMFGRGTGDEAMYKSVAATSHMDLGFFFPSSFPPVSSVPHIPFLVGSPVCASGL